MKKKYSSLETEWSVMDVRELDLEDESVDFAIDKGTLDAFLHGSLWDPPEDVAKNVGLYVDQIMRVLKLGGKWLYITYRQPHFIKPFLYRINSTTDVEVLDDVNGAGCFSYFGYIISKEGNIDSQS
ncbi:putative endothelin-converting enzyme 2 [Erysiphe necator]|uniref:Putative endothelin-converting enzyme 2 n=1 Tax=Uncinula necator TaxID=52586 RepID=A0A0B1P8F5_UNCNE|nr:putative endothelin-converting enzyme 2 [Erysiphe necator]